MAWDGDCRTKLSFETYGAILAREWLLATAEGEPTQNLRDLADSVAETIARHADAIQILVSHISANAWFHSQAH